MLDLLDVKKIDLTVDSTGKCWLNVDERCVARIGHAALVLFGDPVRGQVVVYPDNQEPRTGSRFDDLKFFVFRYRPGEQKTFIAAFISKTDATDFAEEFIEGDNTLFSIEERTK